MNSKVLTFENLPNAVSELIETVSEIRSIVLKERTPIKKRIPLGIDDACRIIGKAKPTIYALVRKSKLPCYKSGKKLYFYEEELIDWIEKGKKKTIDEIQVEAESTVFSNQRKKPSYNDKYPSNK